MPDYSAARGVVPSVIQQGSDIPTVVKSRYGGEWIPRGKERSRVSRRTEHVYRSTQAHREANTNSVHSYRKEILEFKKKSVDPRVTQTRMSKLNQNYGFERPNNKPWASPIQDFLMTNTNPRQLWTRLEPIRPHFRASSQLESADSQRPFKRDPLPMPPNQR